MQPSSTNFLLPKLRLVEGKTKTKSSYSNLVESTHKISEDVNQKYKRQSEFSQAEIKQSRSKSSNFTLSQVKLQYKYVNKSPEYFKKKQRSMQTLSPTHAQDNIAMEQIIEQKIKRFNKDSLINLAKQGLYKNMNYKHRIIPRKRNPPHPYGEPVQSPNINSETKYSSFNPTKIIPLTHSLNKVYPSAMINR